MLDTVTRLLDDLSQITFVLDDMSQKGIDMYQNIWTLCQKNFNTWIICHNYSLDNLSQLYLSHFLDDLSQVISVLDNVAKKVTVIWHTWTVCRAF